MAQHYPMVAPGAAYYLITAGGILAAHPTNVIVDSYPPESPRNQGVTVHDQLVGLSSPRIR